MQILSTSPLGITKWLIMFIIREKGISLSRKNIGFFLFIHLLVLITAGVSPAIDISNDPMETKMKTPPPNIMFVIDNSGSMDWEVATTGTDGMFEVSGTKYAYLYALSDRTYTSGSNSYALSTTALRQYWRSQWSGYNRIYYNQSQTYLPWPGQSSITLTGLSAVRSNPMSAGVTVDLTSIFATIGTVNIGMIHYYAWNDANSNGIVDVGEIYLVNFAVSGSTVTRTYYKMNDPTPTVNTSKVDAADLVLVTGASIPDAIKAKKKLSDGTSVELTASEEALNFANWFGFYRKRIMTAKYAISSSIEEFSGVNVGLYTINDNGDSARIGVLPDKVIDNSGNTNDSSTTLRSTLYGIIANNSTPLRSGLYNVGRYFDVEDTGGFAPTPNTPYCSQAEGGACQQAFAIVMTDGYYNDTFSSVGNADSGMAAPYGDTYSNTLADVAMKFYNDDLANNLPDEVPTNSADSNVRQHLVTYTVSFGVTGTIPLTDLNKDGIADPAKCNYAEDPNFLNSCTPRPVWPDPAAGNSQKIDDMLHTAVNGHGQFFSASNPEELIDAFKAITQSIKTRMASGAAASMNSDTLTADTVLYQSGYDPSTWSGNVYAFPINPSTGEILQSAGSEVWQASTKLQAKPWASRLIATSNGEKTGIPFDYSSLTSLQQSMLGSQDVVDYLRGKTNAAYRTRATLLGDIVHSSPILTGTITKASTTDNIDNDGDGKVDEAGESVGGTVFAGANDGMLHAFNAQTGEERFAFIPNIVMDHLVNLTQTNYSHRFYVDATPVVKALTFAAGDRSHDGIDNDGDGSIDEPDENYSDTIDNNGNGQVDEVTEKKTITMLVGGLGRGGKGYYALDISNADKIIASSSISEVTSMVKWEYPRRYFDGIDNDGNGKIDEPGEAALVNQYVYSYAGNQTSVGGLNYSDGRDNNGDGNVDEKDEKAVFIKDTAGNLKLAYRDDDLGYSLSTPAIVKSYRTKNPVSQTDHPWVVIFGNGYNSYNGHAVLYVLDVLTGELIRKIDTGVGGDNGLSSPLAVDIDDDERIDYVYAGDLKGNLWKFDLTSSNPANWRVANENSSGIIQPLFSAPSQPITARPNAMKHCSGQGIMIIFGTGKFLGETDRTDSSQQSLFGIWDYGDASDRQEYPGTWTRSTNTLSNLSGVKLQRQWLVNEQYSSTTGSYLRTFSAHSPHWYLKNDTTTGQNGDPATIPAYLSDGVDNDNDLRKDETNECDLWSASTNTCLGHTDTTTNESTGHAGWYIDLPGRGSMDGRDNDGDGLIDEAGEKSSLAAERVIKNVTIRDGKLIAVSFIPDDSPCTGGGTSVIHEITACSGGRLTQPAFDITNDQTINSNDKVLVGGQLLVPSGIGEQGLVSSETIAGFPNKDTEMKIFISHTGEKITIYEKKETLGIHYWREVNN